MSDYRLGYPPAAGYLFEEPPHYWRTPYPLGIPKRVADDPRAMSELHGFPVDILEPTPDPRETKVYTQSMTTGDYEGVKRMAVEAGVIDQRGRLKPVHDALVQLGKHIDETREKADNLRADVERAYDACANA